MSDVKEKQSRCTECKFCTTPSHVNSHGDVRSVSTKLKLRWKEVPERGRPSLKVFVRQLVKDGDKMATDWLDHKKGSLNEFRSDKNGSRVMMEKAATKLSRKKVKGKAKKDDAPAV